MKLTWALVEEMRKRRAAGWTCHELAAAYEIRADYAGAVVAGRRWKQPTPSWEDRFWARVAIQRPDQCWPWTAYRMALGYGQVGRRLVADDPTTDIVLLTHRVAWELTYGPIPANMHVCQTCDNRLCCNPAHLFVGTNTDNIADRVRKGRSARAGAKLTWTQVRRLRDQYAAGLTQVELARLYKLTQGQVSHIVNRKQWQESA